MSTIFMPTIEIPIGTKVIVNNVKCVVTEDSPTDYNTLSACRKCFLDGTQYCDMLVCTTKQRTDKKAVHFQKAI